MLAKSAISGTVARERGVFSVESKAELEQLGFGRSLQIVPSLVFPIRGVVPGEPWYVHRPDVTPIKDGRPRKYLIPAGRKMSLDIHPRVRPGLADPAWPLFVTEGQKKVDALVTAGARAVAGVIGVWNWRGRNDHDGLAVLPDWEFVALKEGRQVYVVFDSDVMLKEPVRLAMERMGAALKRMGASIVYVYLPSGPAGKKVGADDFLAAGHALEDIVALATHELRKPPGGAQPRNDKPMPEVDGAKLLDDLRAFVVRFVVLPSDRAADLIALWVLHTWAYEAAFATPYLRITSAAPESGKTLLLEVLATLSRHGWHAINASTPVLYRKIDQQAPTLLLDEMDNYPVDDRRDALSVLNAGYKRGAKVDRCKDDGSLEAFSCFCAKAYAGLDQRAITDTLLSRSVTIRLDRKGSEQVDMWIAPLVEPQAEPLRDRCEAWAHHNVDALREIHPELPDGIVNRGVEVWWALLAIAERVGGDWPRRAREAAATLTRGGDDVDDAPEQVRLLEDIRGAFGDDDAIFTRELLDKLNALDEAPWGARRRGDGLDARGLARILRPFKIKPRTVRTDDETAKGYHRDQFADVFARYLPQPSQASQASHPSPHAERDVTDVTDVTDAEGPRNNDDDSGPNPNHGKPEPNGRRTLADLSGDELVAAAGPGATVETGEGWLCGSCEKVWCR